MNLPLLSVLAGAGQLMLDYSTEIVLGLVALFVFIRSGTIRYIPNNKVGIAEKLWSLSGSLRGGLIALQSEAGY